MKLPFLFTFIGAGLRRRARENAGQGIPPDILSDFVFKALFTANDEDSREALRGLLSACIRRDVASLSIRNNELLPEYLTGKTIRLDINLVFNDGERANIEIQVERTKDNLRARMVFYAAKLLSGQAKRGMLYKNIPRVYQIFFLNSIIFPESGKVPRRYTMREEDEHDQLSEIVEVILYELPKLKEIAGGCFAGKINLSSLPPDQKWGIYFRYRNDTRMAGMLDELCREEEGIMHAERMLHKISWAEKRWIRAYTREKIEMDYWSEINANREEVREEVEAKYQPIVEEKDQEIAELRRKLREAGIE
jgi:hypothetical protein